MLNIYNRAQRKEAKAIYNKPIVLNSKYAFNIKNRDFKIKKYINYRATDLAPQTNNLENKEEKNI
jgi:hypothetical protein